MKTEFKIGDVFEFEYQSPMSQITEELSHVVDRMETLGQQSLHAYIKGWQISLVKKKEEDQSEN